MKGATANPADKALALSARGEVAAFEEIVREHQAMVFSLAYHFLRDRSLAEELAQDVFLQLYRSLSAIESPAHLRFWLRRVTANRCIDQARRRKPQVSLDEVQELSAAVSHSDPMLSGRLQRLVASLPEKARMMVILRYQEELELHEIAEVLCIPINTVKSSLQRALAILRGKLVRAAGGVRV